MHKNSSNHHSDDDNVEKPVVEEVEDQSSDEIEETKEIELLTPPATPHDEISEEKCEKISSKELEIHQEIPTTAREPHNHGAVLLIAMALVIAILYTNISSLKKEFATTASIYEQRIARLEEENQLLKAQLSELIMQLRPKEEIMMPSLNSEKIDEVLLEEKFIERQEEANRQPITKDVWLGGEKEDVVKILDKKYNSLPDYCYFTDESDLFYEYNKEACEHKKRKLDERVKKFHQKNDHRTESVDDIYSTTKRDKDFDDFMTQTREKFLASLNDEIQEIKNSRVSFSITDNDEEEIQTGDKMTKDKNDKRKNPGKSDGKENRQDNTSKKQQKKNVDENQENSKKRKRQRGKEGSGGEWNERRNTGREEARKKKDSEENWFLKRKNDREIHRLERNA